MATNNAVNAPFPLASSQGGSGVASPTAHTLPVAEGASAFTFLGPLTNGQILIGSTGADPVPGTITAGTGISIGTGAGSTTITNTGAGASWVDQTSSSVTMTINTGYVTDNGASLVTYTLPSTAALGSVIEVVGFSSGGWTIHQPASSLIHLGNQVTTTGTGGSLSSTNQYDAIRIVCTVTNTTWVATSSFGNITVV